MKDFQKKLKNIYFIGRYPDKDWRRLFILFTIVAFFIGCWSLYTFIQIKTGVFLTEGRSGSVRQIAETKERELKQVLERYETKERRFKELQAGIPPVSVNAATSTSTLATSTEVVR